MRKLLFLLAVAVGALIAAPAVLADTPLFVTDGAASGVVLGDTRYLLFHSATPSTTLTAASATSGAVLRQLVLPGSWYFPNTLGGAGGLSHDGKTLLLVDLLEKRQFDVTTFLVIDPLGMKLVRRFSPYASIGRPRPPYVLTDALSPDASRLYAVEYTNTDTGTANPCFGEYGYDLGSSRSVSIKTDAARKVSDGTALGRAASADGRRVYTLYRMSGSGALFIQALDTVDASVHCVYLPKSRGVNAVNAVLSLSNDDRTLAVSSGGPRLDVAVGSWRITRVPAVFPWVSLAAGIGGLALLASGGLILVRRRADVQAWFDARRL